MSKKKTVNLASQKKWEITKFNDSSYGLGFGSPDENALFSLKPWNCFFAEIVLPKNVRADTIKMRENLLTEKILFSSTLSWYSYNVCSRKSRRSKCCAILFCFSCAIFVSVKVGFECTFWHVQSVKKKPIQKHITCNHFELRFIESCVFTASISIKTARETVIQCNKI